MDVIADIHRKSVIKLDIQACFVPYVKPQPQGVYNIRIVSLRTRNLTEFLRVSRSLVLHSLVYLACSEYVIFHVNSKPSLNVSQQLLIFSREHTCSRENAELQLTSRQNRRLSQVNNGVETDR